MTTENNNEINQFWMLSSEEANEIGAATGQSIEFSINALILLRDSFLKLTEKVNQQEKELAKIKSTKSTTFTELCGYSEEDVPLLEKDLRKTCEYTAHEIKECHDRKAKRLL